MKTIIKYAEPQPRAGTSPKTILAYTAIFAGLCYLLSFQMSPDAPFRNGSGPITSLVQAEADLRKLNSNPDNVELHFDGLQNLARGYDRYVDRTYYAAAYTRYPRRVYVGQDNQIINNGSQLMSADVLAPVDWLRQHRVSTVFVITDAGMLGPQITALHVP